MKKRRRQSRKNALKNQYNFEQLEARQMLAADLLPDIFAWGSESRGYLYDYYVEGDLLRFSTAFANGGEGHLEVYGGDVLDNGNQEVIQRIYDDMGGFRDRVAGEFTYHSGHGHIHFDGYAIYNLREILAGGEVGDIVATGGKISFCLIDITRYDDDAGSSNYGSCGTTQGVSAGWSDVYSSGLSNQWINIADVAGGDYYLEVVTDPEEQLEESDETNNTTIITVTIPGGSGGDGDRYEPNDTFSSAAVFGMFSDRVEAGLSIHNDTDVDYYQFNAADTGDFDVEVNFSHDLGDINAAIYDSSFNLITDSNSTTDIELLNFAAVGGETYYLEVSSADGLANGYDLEMYGPGEVVSTTIMSEDESIDIPDGNGGSNPGQTITSTLEGPDITLTDLNLLFEDLDHTYLGDLSFDLTSPAGTTVKILRSTFESPGGPLGSENDFTNTWMDDQAPTFLDDGSAPFTGSFNVNYDVVQNPLSAFNGESALGTWTVSVTDWYSADTGTLHSWGLMFTGLDNNPGDKLEQNDAFPQATDLGTIGVANFGALSIHNSSDVDFFRFTAQDSSHVALNIDFVHDEGNLDMVVYDSNQQEIARAETITNDEYIILPVEEGELYYVEVYGFENGTNDYDFAIDIPDVIATSGNAGLIGTSWQTVALDHSFVNPVVIVGAPSMNDGTPVTVDIQNVTSDSFDVRLHNWGSILGGHGGEELSYMVVEAGDHTLRDGTRIVAGTELFGSRNFGDVDFATPFTSTPIVLTQLENSRRTVMTPRIQDVDETGFSARAQLKESFGISRYQIDANWIAIEPGAGSSDGGLFEAGSVTGVTDAMTGFTFGQSFPSTPQVIAATMTTNEIDPANVRIDAITANGADVMVQEETSADAETTHAAETVGYFAFVPGQFFASEASNRPFVPSGDDGNRDDDPVKTLATTTVTAWTGFPAEFGLGSVFSGEVTEGERGDANPVEVNEKSLELVSVQAANVEASAMDSTFEASEKNSETLDGFFADFDFGLKS